MGEALAVGLRLRDYAWQSAYGPADRPLESFYLPALSRAVRYDRIAGFFSSYALAVAAQGVARLVSRGGHMRLLVGAQLAPEDVEAILRGTSLGDRLSGRFLKLLRSHEALADALLRERLEVLAWLVAHGRLEIRVVVEADPASRQPVASGGYFHAKGGALWDEAGDGVAFSGSINETATAWRYNYERFHVFCSWREAEHFQQEVETFERLWASAEVGWVTVPLPEAVQRELVRRAPVEAPVEEPAFKPAAQADARARWVAQYLRDAPYLVHRGWRVGVETAPVEPFPHQRLVAYDVLDRFPCRRLLADEVGLGKTVEAGLILRSLVLSGWVKRCLIIVPRTLARQWQEELRDRFLVRAAFYDGAHFVEFGPTEQRSEPVPEGTNPWAIRPLVIASAQMVKRQQRKALLLEAPDWDLVIVDEAHHARRRDFQDLRRYRTNHMLDLLDALRQKTRAMLLLTATPMQVHPVEVYDLLRLLGLPQGWQDAERFLAFFRQLRQPYEEIDWSVVLPLLREAISEWGWDEAWEAAARHGLGAVGFQRLQTAIRWSSAHHARALSGQERTWMLKALRAHNPVARLVYRHTRSLLREYHRQGILQRPLPERRPEPVWLTMSDAERALYEAVERYISTYFKRYEEERRGLGFVMTAYRRRLTSSLYALKQSLLRHRQVLLGEWTETERPLGLDDEDLEEADLEADEVEGLEGRPSFAAQEVHELDRILRQLERLEGETKAARLRQDLVETLEQWDQVLVFTQYTDTMDFLREELRPTFGARLACYSGRGGEVWDAQQQRWDNVRKDRVQADFAAGRIKVLLCTEAGGEGLNLQNCGVLFNYDMPWNPMKVEQRIGRVDRIGQRRPLVVVRHYFYQGTVEADVYAALGQRIGWFEAVVGELQPILQRAQAAIRRVAMASPDERGALLPHELAALTQEWDAAQEQPSPLHDWRPTRDPTMAEAPVTARDVAMLGTEGVLPELRASASRGRSSRLSKPSAASAAPLAEHGTQDGPGAGPEEVPGTYGRAAFAAALRLPPPPSRPDLVRQERAVGGVRAVGYYQYQGARWEAVARVGALLDALGRPAPEKACAAEGAREQFERECQRLEQAPAASTPR